MNENYIIHDHVLTHEDIGFTTFDTYEQLSEMFQRIQLKGFGFIHNTNTELYWSYEDSGYGIKHDYISGFDWWMSADYE